MVFITEILRRSLDKWNQVSVHPSKNVHVSLFFLRTVSLSKRHVGAVDCILSGNIFGFSETCRLNGTDVAAAKTTLK